MSKVMMIKCDHCDRRADNIYAMRGWIRIGGGDNPVKIVRTTGIATSTNGHNFEIDELLSSDFCSLTCLASALDKRAAVREEVAARTLAQK